MVVGWVGWLLTVREEARAPDAVRDDDAQSHVAGLSAFTPRGASTRACLLTLHRLSALFLFFLITAFTDCSV